MFLKNGHDDDDDLCKTLLFNKMLYIILSKCLSNAQVCKKIFLTLANYPCGEETQDLFLFCIKKRKYAIICIFIICISFL